MLKYSRFSFSSKIIALVSLTILVVGSVTFGSAYYFFSKAFDEDAERRIDLSSVAVQGALDDMLDKVKRNALSFSTRPDLANAVEKKDTVYLQQLGKTLITDNGLQVLTIADLDGKVIARGHSEKNGDIVAHQINVKKALNGEISVGIEEGTVIKYSLRAGAPVKIQGRTVGTLTAGVDLTGTNIFVDGIKKRLNVECTVFNKDERVSTTLEREGKRLTGTKMDNPAVIATVLQKGQKFLNTNVIQGRNYNTVYWPVISSEGVVSGMLFIGSDRAIIEKASRKVISAVFVSLLIIGILMIAAGYVLARSLVRPMLKTLTNLNRSVGQVASATTQVASASQQLAEGASEQAASLEETSSSLEEMTSMTKQNADSANQANQLMTGTRETVSRASRAMEKLTTSMGEISRASQETSKIIKTIDEIAFQTNLLALNAAVEAARAGEAGAGFAVVADEVRNLAMRASEAAKNTADLIEGTVKRIREGSELVEGTEREFQEVALGVGRSSELVGEISAASHEQAQGIEQVNKAVNEIDKVVQKNAANAEETASSSEEMNAHTHQMSEFVSELILQVNGGKIEERANEHPDRALRPARNFGTARGDAGVRVLSGKKPDNVGSKGKRMIACAGKKGEVRPSEVIPFDDQEIKGLEDF